MGHPKSHHVSELSPKENQAPRSNISQHVNGEHLKKKKRQWTNKQSDASLLAMSKELECLEQCCSRGHLNIFFLT